MIAPALFVASAAAANPGPAAANPGPAATNPGAPTDAHLTASRPSPVAQRSTLAQSQPAQPLQPPPLPSAVPATSTEYQLDRAEREDSGRGLQFVMLHADVGFQWVSLDAISDSDLVDGDLVESEALGITVGGGIGVRLLYLTVGARFRYGLLNQAALWSLGLEGNLRIPQGAFEPYALIGAGFAQVAKFEGASDVFDLGDREGSLTANGLNIRLGGGFDYFLTPVFSVGARADAELLFLGRGTTISSAQSPSIYEDDGSAVGIGLSGLAALGLHF